VLYNRAIQSLIGLTSTRTYTFYEHKRAFTDKNLPALTGWRDQFRALPIGHYYIASFRHGNLGGHAMVYIKKSATEGYFFDPNFGVQKLEGSEHWRSVAKGVMTYGHHRAFFCKITRRNLLDKLSLDLRSWLGQEFNSAFPGF
jgi:hypothetical protein